VYFTNDGLQRPSADQALQYKFLSGEYSEMPSLVELGLEEGSSQQNRGLFGFITRIQTRMTHLEDDIIRTVLLRLTDTVRKAFFTPLCESWPSQASPWPLARSKRPL
jgi:hypothetical protein